MSSTQNMQKIMTRKKMTEIERIERSRENRQKSEREKEEGVLQRGSHRPAVRCMAEAHHSANYDQAFPCRHSSTGNGKSLFSHTPMEAMGHGAMQMRCLYTHTHTHKQVCNIINTTCTHCAYSHTYILVYRGKNTDNHHSHHS